jgi:hypothetical protein
MRPDSKDLGGRALAAVDSEVPRGEVAKTFSVSVLTIKLAQEAPGDRRYRARADPQAFSP